jgi:hypothetical protein
VSSHQLLMSLPEGSPPDLNHDWYEDESKNFDAVKILNQHEESELPEYFKEYGELRNASLTYF